MQANFSTTSHAERTATQINQQQQESPGTARTATTIIARQRAMKNMKNTTAKYKHTFFARCKSEDVQKVR
jgi:hypothetical protein